MDYAGFVSLWLNGGAWKGARLLAEATVATALRPHGRMGEAAAYGYGWFVDDVEASGTDPFWHGGGDGTVAMAFPRDRALVVYLTHSRGGSHRAALWNRLAMSGLFRYPGPGIGEEPMVWAAGREVGEVALSPEQRARLAGSYTAPQNGREPVLARILDEDRRLELRIGRPGAKADRRFHLVPLRDGRFAPGRYAGGILRGIDPVHSLRFVGEGTAPDALEVRVDDRLVLSARRVE